MKPEEYKLIVEKEYNERRKLEQEMDRWFYNLTTNQQADFACSFWGEMDFEDKKEEYYIE